MNKKAELINLLIEDFKKTSTDFRRIDLIILKEKLERFTLEELELLLKGATE